MRKSDILHKLPLFSWLYNKLLDNYGNRLKNLKNANKYLQDENSKLKRFMYEVAFMDTREFTKRDMSNCDDRGVPLPPPLLQYLVMNAFDDNMYLDTGRAGAETIFDVFEKRNIDMNNFTRILDIGCGCGRVIRYFKDKFPAELYGADISKLAIEWCRNNLTFAKFDVNGMEPPMKYEAASFDLIYGFSVFTHLNASLQKAWMQEFQRILKPGGYLLLSLHGDPYAVHLTQEQQETYKQGKMVIIQDDLEGSNFCNAFHPPAYVKGEFSTGFEILEFIPSGARGNPTQDLYLFQLTVSS